MATDLFAKYSCTYCQSDITGLRVKCYECQDFELCLQCFSAGAEIGPHKNDHSYQFVDSGALDLFRDRSGWSAREELQLLNAIERYSFGNWETISQQIETRTPDEARDEYVSRFMEGSIGRMTWSQAMNSRPVLSDLTVPDAGPLAPSTIARLPSLDITREEASQLGYMPLRDDFEREFDNEAEVLVSSLVMNGMEDDDLDVAMKLAQVDMYTQRLRERARRRRVARDYQLAAQFFGSRRDRPRKRMSREKKELEERLRPICQFHTATEHKQFLAGLLRLRDLSRRLTELLRYRRNGLTRFEELPHFEQERLARHNSRSGSSALITPMKHSQLFKGGGKSVEEGQACSKKSSTHCSPGVESNKLPTESTQLSQHLLSPTEVQLCTTLELTPLQYISMKTLMLTDPTEKVETPAEEQVLNHIMQSGWFAAVG
ncbi:transcriptional adapter 2b-like isoform X2 [Lycorma delicatula]|uniref:transcriptional adapter 2b-like isoform X2 n=1 Tax=Lycorma delicatula TaxID=130591 RepID=UPI003F510DC8